MKIEDIPLGGVFIVSAGRLQGVKGETVSSPLVRIWSNVIGEIRAASLVNGDTWTMGPELWNNQREFRLVLQSAAPSIEAALSMVDAGEAYAAAAS